MSLEHHLEPSEIQRNLLDTTPGRILAATVIATEVSPLNEVIRGALTVGAGVISKDPIVAAGVFAASTAVIEGGAMLVAAEAVDSAQGKKLTEKIHGKLRSVGIGEKVRTNAATDLGVGLLGGSAVAILVKQAQDPERTKAKNRSFGTKLTASTSLICGGLGYAAAEGIANPSAETIGASVIAVGGLATLIGWAKKKVAQ